MRHFLLLSFIMPLFVFSQCPPTGGVFTTQAQIDALATDYPNCTEVDGFLISGDDITDLSGLNQINSCTGFSISGNLILQNTIGLNPNIVIRYVEGTGTAFFINNNNALLTIDGLENFTSQSGFESNLFIENNPSLTSLQGLPNSFNALSSMKIENNDSLMNLNGIGNLSGSELTIITGNDNLLDFNGIGSMTAEVLVISNNNNLQSLNGSEGVNFYDILRIEDNENLTDISAIYAGNWLIHDLEIRNNPNLSLCSSQNVCDFFSNIIEEYEMLRGTFENNAPGCNSVYEVEYGCGVHTNDEARFPFWSLTLGETITASNEFATTSSQTPSCNDLPDRKDVWFFYYADETMTIDLFVDPGFYMQFWESNGPFNLTLVDNACGTELTDIPVVFEGEYYIQIWNDDVLDRGGSSWFDLTIQDANLSTQEFQLENIKLFPNPVTDILNILTKEPTESIEIFNLLGQTVKALGIDAKTIDMTNFADGLYLVKVKINGKESTFKVLKE